MDKTEDRCQHRKNSYSHSKPFVACGEPATMLIELGDRQILVPMCRDHGYDTLSDGQLSARAVSS